MGLQVFCRIEGKGFSVEVECNDDAQHNNRQRRNNFISVPGCDTNGINEHLTPKIVFTLNSG